MKSLKYLKNIIHKKVEMNNNRVLILWQHKFEKCVASKTNLTIKKRYNRYADYIAVFGNNQEDNKRVPKTGERSRAN